MAQWIAQTRKPLFCAVVGTVWVLCSPTPALADAGIPMLPVAYPVILLSLVPVIGIEVLYIRTRLKTGWWDTLVATAGANFVTLLLGYPLVWVVMLMVEFGLSWVADLIRLKRLSEIFGYLIFALSPAWINPTKDRWPVLLAFAILLIPSFFLSAFVEAELLDEHGWLLFEGSSARTVWKANILSYLFLVFAGCIALWLEMSRH